MSLLVDNQLPVALARYLGAHGRSRVDSAEWILQLSLLADKGAVEQERVTNQDRRQCRQIQILTNGGKVIDEGRQESMRVAEVG